LAVDEAVSNQAGQVATSVLWGAVGVMTFSFVPSEFSSGPGWLLERRQFYRRYVEQQLKQDRRLYHRYHLTFG